MEYSIKKAECRDSISIVEVLNKVTLDLQSKNINQWNYPWNIEEVEIDIRKGNAYIVQNSKKVIATFSMKNIEIKQWFTNIECESLYLYRIAILPEYQGNGIGRKIIKYAFEIVRDLHKDLYLDCWQGNMKLKDFYSNNGFCHCGDFKEEDYIISVFKGNVSYSDDR